MFVNVLIVTDSQHAPQISGKGSQRMGGGHIGLLFLSLFLSVFLISFCLFLAESDCLPDPRLGVKEGFFLFFFFPMMVGAFCGPRLYRPL